MSEPMEEHDDEDWGEEYEEHAALVGCTCEHTGEEHGWGECNVPDCPCEGGWEE